METQSPLSVVLQAVRLSVLSRLAPLTLTFRLLRLRATGRSDATVGMAEASQSVSLGFGSYCPTLGNIEGPEAVVRWSRGQEFAVEHLAIDPHTRAQLKHYVKRRVQKPTEIDR